MYCTNCGTQGSGNFCGACGTRLADASVPFVKPVPEILPANDDWHHEVRYAVLLHFPAVRDRLAAVPEAAKKMTGEAWLGLYDKAIGPLTGSPVSLQTVAKIAAPIYAKLGVKTGKSRAATVARPTGLAIVDVLCALARHGLPLDKVHQGDAGCVIEAKLPSDLFALEGQVVVTVERRDARTTHVEAATTIPGQWFDWGKSTRCLARLFDDLGPPLLEVA